MRRKIKKAPPINTRGERKGRQKHPELDRLLYNFHRWLKRHGLDDKGEPINGKK